MLSESPPPYFGSSRGGDLDFKDSKWDDKDPEAGPSSSTSSFHRWQDEQSPSSDSLRSRPSTLRRCSSSIASLSTKTIDVVLRLNSSFVQDFEEALNDGDELVWMRLRMGWDSWWKVVGALCLNMIAVDAAFLALNDIHVVSTLAATCSICFAIVGFGEAIYLCGWKCHMGQTAEKMKVLVRTRGTSHFALDASAPTLWMLASFLSFLVVPLTFLFTTGSWHGRVAVAVIFGTFSLCRLITSFSVGTPHIPKYSASPVASTLSLSTLEALDGRIYVKGGGNGKEKSQELEGSDMGDSDLGLQSVIHSQAGASTSSLPPSYIPG